MAGLGIEAQAGKAPHPLTLTRGALERGKGNGIKSTSLWRKRGVEGPVQRTTVRKGLYGGRGLGMMPRRGCHTERRVGMRDLMSPQSFRSLKPQPTWMMVST